MVNKNHGHETCVNVTSAKILLNRRLFENFFQKKKEKEIFKIFPNTASDRWHEKMAHNNLNLYMLGKDT